MRFVVTALLVLPLSAKKDYAEYKLSSLQRLLDVRELTCNGCASKEDWVAAVRQHVQLEKRPVVPELEAAYRERAAYAKRANDFRMTREEFFTQLRAEADEVQCGHCLPCPRNLIPLALTHLDLGRAGARAR